MASWYPYGEDTWGVQVGVEWNASVYDTSVSLAPKVYRWDNWTTENYGSRWWEVLKPDYLGAGSWSGLSWGIGSGTREIDSFGTRWYSRGKDAYDVTLTIGTDDSFGTYTSSGFSTIGSWQYSWTYTIPALPSYTVSYNANGGRGAPSAQTKWFNETLTLSLTVPTRANYKFLGWSTSPTATSASYGAGGSYTANSGTTLYAVWELDIFTITYNNGSDKNSANYNYGNSTYTWPSAALEGWSFYGWANSNSSVTRAYSSGAALKDIGTKNVYAVFSKEINVYNGDEITTQELYYNPSGGVTSISLPAIDSISSKDWQAVGWSTSGVREKGWENLLLKTVSAFSTPLDISSSKVCSIYKRNVNLYDGSSVPTVSTRYASQDGEGWYISKLPGQAKKEGWTSLGWRTDTAIGEGNTKDLSDVGSFYGVYSRTASFYTGVGCQKSTQYWNSSGAYYLQIPTPTPYNNEDNWEICDKPWSTVTTPPSNSEGEDTLLPSGNYTGGNNVFYATYKRKINIIYDNNVPSGTNSSSSGKVDSTQTTGYQYYNASSQSAVSSLQLGSLTTQKYSRVGYNFTGWYLSNGVKQSASSTISPNHETTSVTLYAGWEIIQPTPEITNLICYRVDKDGNKSDEGEFVFLSFIYSQKQDVGTTSTENREQQPFQISVSPQGTISCHSKTDISSTNAAFENKNGTSFETILKLNNNSDGGFSTENQYEFTVTATVYNIEGTNTNLQGKSVSSSSDTILTKSFFTVDFLAGGTGVALGTPSSGSGFINNMEASFFKGFSIYPEKFHGRGVNTGGRNYITRYVSGSNEISLITDEQVIDTKGKATVDFVLSTNLLKSLKPTETITLSFETNMVQSSGQQFVDFYWRTNSTSHVGNSYYYPSFEIEQNSSANEWSEYKISLPAKGFTTPTISYDSFKKQNVVTQGIKYLRLRKNTTNHGGSNSSNPFLIRKVKLERGPSKSTWIPAPEEAALFTVEADGVKINGRVIVDELDGAVEVANKASDILAEAKIAQNEAAVALEASSSALENASTAQRQAQQALSQLEGISDTVEVVQGYRNEALEYKNAAATSATKAASSESAALSSKNAAATSATNASTSATNASKSATAAATSATNASTSATNAASSESAAATSATNAATSATNAASSESAALASKNAAATYEQQALASKNAASTYKQQAADSAAAAANSATEAAGYTSDAGISASIAQTALESIVESSEYIYYATNSTTAPSKPTAQVTQTGNVTKQWTLSKPSWDGTNQNVYSCSQMKVPHVNKNTNPPTVTYTYAWSTPRKLYSDLSGQYFWHDTSGAHVANDSNNDRLDINSTSINIIKSGVTKASFGESILLGQETNINASHVKIDDNGLSIFNKVLDDSTSKSEIAKFSKDIISLGSDEAHKVIIDTEGIKMYKKRSYGMVQTAFMSFSNNLWKEGTAVYEGAFAAFGENSINLSDSSSDYYPGRNSFIINESNKCPGWGSIVGGVSNIAKGAKSVVLGGLSNAAIGTCSVVIGGEEAAYLRVSDEHEYNNAAVGYSSCVIGCLGGYALGRRSAVIASEGYKETSINYMTSGETRPSKTTGAGSVILGGAGLEAFGQNQIVCGSFNVADTTSAIIIGNGKAKLPGGASIETAKETRAGGYILMNTVQRSNAFKMDWDGNSEIAGSVTLGTTTGSNGATLQYDDTNKCLNFIFI